MGSQGGLPIPRACAAVGLGRATYDRPLVDWARREAPVIAALTTLVAAKSRWGFWKGSDRLRLDGQPWNPKRLWRVYGQLRLKLPRRTKKRLPVRLRQPLVVMPPANAVWAVDFMSDTLDGGRRFRTLHIRDEGVREGLAIEIDMSLPGGPGDARAGAGRGLAGPAAGDSARPWAGIPRRALHHLVCRAGD